MGSAFRRVRGVNRLTMIRDLPSTEHHLARADRHLGVLIRQWGPMGPGPSGLTPAVLAQPDKEAREIVRRLPEWRYNVQVNLDWIRAHVER
jgi:hypothetical protein